MARERLQNLRKAAKKAASSESKADKIEALSEAFKMFSEEAQRLEEAHTRLKDEFQRVNLELEATNQRLSRKVHELDISTRYLKKILSNMSQGLLLINLAGIITTCNKAIETILGVPSIEILFCRFDACFKDNLFGFSMKEALAKKQVPRLRVAEIGTEGSQPREIEIDARFLLREENDTASELWDESLDLAQGLILLLRDVTVERQHKRLADRNDRLKELGEMAAMVAHEIRNPLGGIKGFASLLQRDLKDQTELQKMASYIVEGTENLNKLVTNVLHYSRPVHLQSEVVDLVDQLHQISKNIQMDASLGKGIKIIVQSDVDTLYLALDRQLLQAALLNLMVNAVQAMPKGGTITLAVITTEQEAMIRVTDTGTGIAPEYLEKIFSPFFTTKPEGNGFGLSEVNKVIQAHRGSIEVHSQIGLGTTFTIKLPIKTPIPTTA